MGSTRARRLLARVSILDLLTVVVLMVAVFLFIRPGSALHASATGWLALRSMEGAAERNWDELAAVATPLYAGDGEPEVIEFSDYECPFCRSANHSVDSAVAAGVRVALVHLPLRIHASARPAALAALCAERIGRFTEVHHFFMTTSAWRADTAWSTLPGLAELARIPAFASCLADSDAESQLEKHLALADSLRIDATPSFVSRRGVLTEAPTASNLIALARPR